MDTRWNRTQYLCNENNKISLKNIQKREKSNNIKPNLCSSIGRKISQNNGLKYSHHNDFTSLDWSSSHILYWWLSLWIFQKRGCRNGDYSDGFFQQTLPIGVLSPKSLRRISKLIYSEINRRWFDCSCIRWIMG